MKPASLDVQYNSCLYASKAQEQNQTSPKILLIFESNEVRPLLVSTKIWLEARQKSAQSDRSSDFCMAQGVGVCMLQFFDPGTKEKCDVEA